MVRPRRLPEGAALAVAAAFVLASPALAQDPDLARRQALSLILLPLLLVGAGALQGVIAMLFPRWTAATRESLETRRGYCVGWGAAISALALLLLLGGGALQGALAVLALLIDLAVLLVAAFGFVGAAALAGAQLLPSGSLDGDRTPVQSLVGGLVLCLSFLAPVLGQALALLVFWAGLGAAARALLAGGRSAGAR